MLRTRSRFASIAPRPVGAPAIETSATVTFTCPSRAAVDDLVAAAIGNGGVDNGREHDDGQIYLRSASDPDGNVIEAMWVRGQATVEDEDEDDEDEAGDEDDEHGDTGEEDSAAEPVYLDGLDHDD